MHNRMFTVMRGHSFLLFVILTTFSVAWIVDAAPEVADSRLSSPAGIYLQASGGQNDVMLEWQLLEPLLAPFNFYQIERLDVAANQVQLLPTPAGLISSHIDNYNLQAGRVYCYVVIAYHFNGVSQIEIGRSNQACVTAGQLQFVIQNQIIAPNSQNVPISINLENGNGLCPVAIDIKLTFDNTVIVPVVELNGQGKVTNTSYNNANYTIVANVNTPGEMKISAYTTNCVMLFGKGTFLTSYFNVVGGSGSNTVMDFVTGITATAIYDEDDLLTPVSADLVSGLLQIQVAYTRGDVNGDEVVNAVDALMALMIVTNDFSPSDRQLLACDVNGDAACTAADASVILCYAAYNSWTECGLTARQAQSQAADASNATPIDLKVGTVVDLQANYVTVPLDIHNAAEFSGGSLDLVYDSAELTFVKIVPRDLSDDFRMHVNSREDGLLQIALASHMPINSDANGLFDIVFRINDPSTPLNHDVRVASVQLSDHIGRDLLMSSLQRTIGVSAQPSEAEHLLYIPTIIR